MELSTLLNGMPGAIAQGLIWGIMAIGVYITFKIMDIADLTVDGTLCTGGAVCVMSGGAYYGAFAHHYGNTCDPCGNTYPACSVFGKP